MSGISSGEESFTINLYPMLDIFSILICFLLMNFSTQAQSIDVKANLQLPRSEVKLTLDEAATVSVTKNEIIVQGGVSVPIGSDGDVAESERAQGAIRRVFEEFKKIKKNNETLKNRDKALALTESDINLLTLEADKVTSFKLLKRVMLSAQQAEFVSWKFATDKMDVN